MIIHVQCQSFSSAAPADDAGPPGPMSYDDDNNVPAPEKSKVACPQCIVTGVVDILKDICKKQGELLSDLFCAILKHSEETKFKKCLCFVPYINLNVNINKLFV